MPFLDRYWWLRPLLAITILVVGAFLIVQLISSEIDLQRYGISIDFSDYLFMGAATLFFIALALGIGLSTLPAFRRKRSRLAAITGNTSLMPLANVEQREEHLPDLAHESLTLQWQATNYTRLTSGPRIALSLLQIGVIAVLGLVILIGLIVKAFQEGTFTLRDLLIPVVALIVAAIIVGCVVLGRLAWRALERKPFGIVARYDGISCRSQLGRESFLRWEDIRLFEVARLGLVQPTARRFRLYTTRDSAVWNYNPLSQELAPADIGAAEMAHRIQLLIEVIHARTGLYPRTFSKALQVSTKPTPTRKRISRDGVVLDLLVFILNVAVVAFAASLLLVPFSDSSMLNIIAATPLFLIVLVEVILIVVRRRMRPTGSIATSSPEPTHTVSAPWSTTGTYIFDNRSSPALQWTNAIVGIDLSVGLLPGAIDLVHVLNLPPLAVLPVNLNGDFGLIAGYILGAFGIVGAALLANVLMRRTSYTVLVEEAGLTIRLAQMQIPFLWDEIQTITLATRNRVPQNYEMRDKARKLIASWRTNIPAAPRTAADVQPLSSDEFAALVSARSGIPIETREQR